MSGGSDNDKSYSQQNGSVKEDGKTPDPYGTRMFPSKPNDGQRQKLSNFLKKDNSIPNETDFAKLKAQKKPTFENYNGEEHLIIDNNNNKSLEQEVEEALGYQSYDNSVEDETPAQKSAHTRISAYVSDNNIAQSPMVLPKHSKQRSEGGSLNLINKQDDDSGLPFKVSFKNRNPKNQIRGKK